MPAYISHAIMADKLHQNHKNDSRIFKNDIDVEELKTYSLGADLASISRRLKYNPHKKYTKDFFLRMICYIKRNRLMNNRHVMALLYGHMAHYYLDICVHPFVYYLSHNATNHNLIPSHQIIEGYLDDYLATNILNRNIMDLDSHYFNKADLDNMMIKEVLNDVYSHIYGDNDIVKSYKDTVKIFTYIETLLKSPMMNRELLIKLTRLREFLKINHLSEKDLVNSEHNEYFNPVTGLKDNKNIEEMFDKAMNLTLEAIMETNKYLYGSYNSSIIRKIFNDLSYDTGAPCYLGDKMVYVKKYR